MATRNRSPWTDEAFDALLGRVLAGRGSDLSGGCIERWTRVSAEARTVFAPVPTSSVGSPES